MKSDHLLARAKAASSGARRPRSTDLCRAVSDIYYAVFHRLAALSADALVGATRRKTESWTRVYRALDHRRAKEELRKLAIPTQGADLRTIAIAFIELQELRHAADYDPTFQMLRRSDLTILIAQAEAAIAAADSLDAHMEVELATRLLFSGRK